MSKTKRFVVDSVVMSTRKLNFTGMADECVKELLSQTDTKTSVFLTRSYWSANNSAQLYCPF